MVVAFDIMTSRARIRRTLFHQLLAGAAVGAIGIAMIGLAVPYDTGVIFDLMAQLHESQKIESLGRLAGGVAHEMNNVLAAILGSAEARRSTISPADPMAHTLEAIINACVRGRTVVRSLLYFSRPVIETRGPVDLNDVCGEIVELLGRTTFSKIHFVSTMMIW